MEMGWSDCFYDTVELGPFYRWRGSSLSVCYSVLHGLKRPGAHTLPTMPRGQNPSILGSTLAPGSGQGTSRRLSGHHGVCFAFLLTCRARLWYARLESGGYPTSGEVGLGRPTSWGLVVANLPTCRLLFWLC